MCMIVSEKIEAFSLSSSLSKKLEFVDRLDQVKSFVDECPALKKYLDSAPAEEEWVVKSILAIGQGPIIFRGIESTPKEDLRQLIDSLLPIEKYYAPIGGIIGYHNTVLKLLSGKPLKEERPINYLQPPRLDITKEDRHVRRLVRWGIEHQEQTAEIYPVGGSGDRLNLIDQETGEPLPAAVLPFCGKTLIAGLLRDLQAREYLHFKLTGKSSLTPIALMTSVEKDNHAILLRVFEENKWFERPKSSFFFFKQPLVPVVSEEGNWVTVDPLKLLLKPGGHGVIWKLAADYGVFDWLHNHGRKYAIVRQINNPIAGTDDALLALAGKGGSENKTFGFASCDRRIGAPEGMNVLIEEKTPQGFAYHISNIEYTDFEKKEIKDEPAVQGSRYSKFPSNTNILFVDLEKIRPLAEKNPVPGLLINLKHSFPYTDHEGNTREVVGGRLETTMQNLADDLVDIVPAAQNSFEFLQTFLTFNTRSKTIAVTKSSYQPEGMIEGTPIGAYYTLIRNGLQLLANECRFTVPEICDEDAFAQKGPPVHFLYHPGLGPNYSVISQKIRGGTVSQGSEIQLEIAELDIENLSLDGSLQILADSPCGLSDSTFSNAGGKCVLRNVRVQNKGIDWSMDQEFWQNQILRTETLEIILHGNGEFHAENVSFRGGSHIEVQDGYRVTALEEEGKVVLRSEKISGPSWFWKYFFDSEDRIILKKWR